MQKNKNKKAPGQMIKKHIVIMWHRLFNWASGMPLHLYSTSKQVCEFAELKKKHESDGR